MSFWLCGYNGHPDKEAQPLNHIRLKLKETDAIIVSEFPPRSDTAQHVEWDLSQWIGKQGFIELVDADTGDAFAWLGAGRFSPGVVELPVNGMFMESDALQLALQIADQLRMQSLATHVIDLLNHKEQEEAVRTIAASVAMSLDRDTGIDSLVDIVVRQSEPLSLRRSVAGQLGNVDLEKVRTALASALESAPASLQQPLALALATTRLGSETLLDVIAKGKASARLLQDKPVIDRLQRTELPDIEERIAVLTKNIPAIDDRLKQTIVKLSTRQSIEAASLETGAALFKKSCANCHRLNGEGGKVGPQLDGIGLRGMDRVVEDVIDPNRNVDAAFRATTLALSNGQILTGLKLREEGGNVIVADSQGKELTIPFSEIDESNSSNLSPMPSNVVEQIGEENLPHLIAFLLQQKQKKEEKDASGK